MKLLGHLLFLTAVLFTLSWLALKPQTFYSNDTGLRFLQTRQFIAQQWQSAHIPYPDQTYDPSFEHVPYYYAYSISNQLLYLSISLFFPFLLSICYAFLGWTGLIIPMSIGALMSAYGVYRLAELCQLKRPHLWLWLAVFGTPIIFYSVQLWDHSLATGFTTLGMTLTAVALKSKKSRPMFLGSTLIGLSLAQRPESYLFAGAAALALLVALYPSWKRMLPFAAGGLLGTAVSWLFNFYWLGHALGFPLANRFNSFGVPDAYPVDSYSELVITPALKMGRLLLHINARDPLTFFAALLLLFAIVLLFFGLRVPRYQRANMLWAGFGCVAVAFTLWSIESFQQAIAGILSTLPLLPLSLAFVQMEKRTAVYRIYQFVFFTAVFYVVGMVLLWPAFGGEQWGARYLLHAYPLLLFSAAYAIDHYQGILKRPLSQTLSKIAVGFMLTSVLFQLLGLRFLYSELYGKQDVRDEIAALESDFIFTNHPFLPSFMSTIEDKQFFFVDNDTDLITLITTAYNTGVRQITILPLEAGQLSLPDNTNTFTIKQTGAATYQLAPIQ